MMISQLLSRYRPRYIRSLVYMLQSCEYNIRDYLAWYGRTKDFSRVERRKQLVKTPKALALLVLAWLLVILWGVGVMWFIGSTHSDIPLLVGALVVLAMPFYFPYALLIPLYFLQVAQLPVETYLMRKARQVLHNHPAVKIAIAGSFGKTSMREILKTVLEEVEAPTPRGRGPDRSVGRKKVASPPFSYNTPLGICRFAEQLKGDEDVLIFELGEYYPGDVMKLCKLIDPKIGVITGVNEAHLEKFKTIERTTSTIFELGDYLSGKPKKQLYINGENELAKSNARGDAIIYTRDGAGKWRVRDAHTDLDGTTFMLESGNEKIEVRSELLGLHMLGPLAVAADIASRMGLTSLQIQSGIAKTRPFEHRLEKRVDDAGVITLDDSYNGNSDGVEAVISFLASLTGHRRFYVTPGLVEMGSRKEMVHKEIGKKLALAGIEKVVLIKNSVTSYIENGLKEANYKGEIIWFDDALAAYAALPHLTIKGDVVLLQNDWPDQYA